MKENKNKLNSKGNMSEKNHCVHKFYGGTGLVCNICHKPHKSMNPTPQPTTEQSLEKQLKNYVPPMYPAMFFKDLVNFIKHRERSSEALGRAEAIEFYEHKLAQTRTEERNKVIEEVKVIVKENIFPDENILAETDESKIVRTYANFKFEEVIKELNQLKGNNAK